MVHFAGGTRYGILAYFKVVMDFYCVEYYYACLDLDQYYRIYVGSMS